MIHRIAFALFTIVVSASGPTRAAEEWPQFRGPTGQGISTAKNVPTKWSAQQNVAWKTTIPGDGWSSPAVSDGKVYLTTAATDKSGPLTLRALCLDAGSGKILWDTEIFKPDPAMSRKMHKKNSPASPTPIISGDRIYVHFGPLGTAALDLSGKVIWRQNEITFSPVHGNGGSPALVDGLLIFSCDGDSDPFLAAIDAGTGAVKWKTPRDVKVGKPFSFSTPLAIEVHGQTQVISPASGLVGAYEPATGRELWRVRYGEGYSVVPRPVFANDMLYISSGFNIADIYAIKPAGATGDVTAQNVAWKIARQGPNTPSLLVVGQELYCVSDKGIAICADAKTGKVIWSERLTGGYSSSPVAAEGRIYFQNETGLGTVIKAGRNFEKISENDLGERSLASYAVVDGALFIRTDKHLWRIAAGK